MLSSRAVELLLQDQLQPLDSVSLDADYSYPVDSAADSSVGYSDVVESSGVSSSLL